VAYNSLTSTIGMFPSESLRVVTVNKMTLTPYIFHVSSSRSLDIIPSYNVSMYSICV
jgi:hypothetical protein